MRLRSLPLQIFDRLTRFLTGLQRFTQRLRVCVFLLDRHGSDLGVASQESPLQAHQRSLYITLRHDIEKGDSLVVAMQAQRRQERQGPSDLQPMVVLQDRSISDGLFVLPCFQKLAGTLFE